MKRTLLLTVAAVLAVAVRADGPPVTERARMLQRNRALIEVVVRNGLHLAQEPTPTQRAAALTGVAEAVASELEQAADRNDGQRVAEMGQHLQTLLHRAVAPHLADARRQTPRGSSEERRLTEIHARTAQLVRRLEEQLQRTPAGGPDEVRRLVRGLREGQREVDLALQAR